jgi:hypothetical protein
MTRPALVKTEQQRRRRRIETLQGSFAAARGRSGPVSLPTVRFLGEMRPAEREPESAGELILAEPTPSLPTFMTKLRWTKTSNIGRLPVYVAECQLGEYVVVMDYDGWLLMSFPPNSDRRQPTWERGPFPTVKTAKAAAQRHEDSKLGPPVGTAARMKGAGPETP